MQVLVLCDDYWHPAEIIEMGLQPLKRAGFSFTLVKNALDILTPGFLADFPVIMCCKGNHYNSCDRQRPWFVEHAEVGVAELADFVHAGGGFLAVHSGNTAREGEPYADFVGNYFVGHPPRCEVTASVVPGHPITAGVQDFLIRDEHYEINLTCQDAEVFLKTRSATGGEQVGGYTRTLGKGRLCSLTPGHILDVWHNSSYQRLLGNALLYCTKQL